MMIAIREYQIDKDFDFVIRAIESCTNTNHLVGVAKLIRNFYKKHTPDIAQTIIIARTMVYTVNRLVIEKRKLG